MTVKIPGTEWSQPLPTPITESESGSTWGHKWSCGFSRDEQSSKTVNPCSFFRANEAFLHRKSFPLKDQVPGAELQVLKQDWQDEQKVYDLRSSGGKKGEEGGLGLSGTQWTWEGRTTAVMFVSCSFHTPKGKAGSPCWCRDKLAQNSCRPHRISISLSDSQAMTHLTQWRVPASPAVPSNPKGWEAGRNLCGVQPSLTA